MESASVVDRARLAELRAEGWSWRPATVESGLPVVQLEVLDWRTGRATWVSAHLVAPVEHEQRGLYKPPPQQVGHEWKIGEREIERVARFRPWKTTTETRRVAMAACPWCGTWGPEDDMVKAKRQVGWRAIEVDRRPKSRLGARIGPWDPQLVRIPNIESALVCVACALPGPAHPQKGLARAGKPRLVKK